MTPNLTSTDTSVSKSHDIADQDTPSSPRTLPLPPSPPLRADEDSKVSAAQSARVIQSALPKPTTHQTSTRSGQHLSPSTPTQRPHSLSLPPPPMQRAYSSPGVDSTGRYIAPGLVSLHRPASPLSAGRRRSPLRGAIEEPYVNSSWSSFSMEPNIPENEELDLSDRLADTDLAPAPIYHNTFPRSRRRPTSPLHASASAPMLAHNSHVRATSPHISGTQSPSQRYQNESYPTSFSYSFSSASSMPSTPSSLRSRSPSVSSLETIEDTPDLEEEARIAAEEAAKQERDEGPAELRRRSSADSRANLMKSNKERKRWSVCGAERRADFSLEVIEE